MIYLPIIFAEWKARSVGTFDGGYFISDQCLEGILKINIRSLNFENHDALVTIPP